MAKTSQSQKLPSSHRANLSNMKLLVSDKEFQEIVAEIRKALKIPEGGFTTNDEASSFDSWLCRASDEIMRDESYRKRGRTIFDDRDSGKIDREEYYRRINLHDEEIPLNYMAGRTQFIVEKFNLPENYREHIERYIRCGRIAAPSHNFTVGWGPVHRNDREFKIPRHVKVTFYTVPTDEDLRGAKKMAEQLARHKGLPRYRPLKNIDRDLNIEEWYSDRIRFDKANFIEYETSTSEIAEEYFGDPTKDGEVRTVVRDLKRTRKDRFHSRGKSN